VAAKAFSLWDGRGGSAIEEYSVRRKVACSAIVAIAVFGCQAVIGDVTDRAPESSSGADAGGSSKDADVEDAREASAEASLLDAAEAGTTCPPGQAFCNGGCIEVTGDQNNCGGCGIVCSTCTIGACGCVKTITSTLSTTSPFSAPVTIHYEMIGGGGGGGGAANNSGSGAGGGGGGSSEIVFGSGAGSPIVAQGGAGGATGPAASTAYPGERPAPAAGSFVLTAGQTLAVYVGGGGGGVSSASGNGCGGAGGPDGQGGLGGLGASPGIAGGGTKTDPGNHCTGANGAAGGLSSTDATYGGGGGGGYGGGGDQGKCPGVNNCTGGSSGGNSTNAAPDRGGYGADTWAAAKVLPTEAGAGGAAGTYGPTSVSGGGGNAGLVILTYTAPAGQGCSL
jgi:hypothetical protein